MIKDCYILDSTRGMQFVGKLNTELVGTAGYPFYEIPNELYGKTVKVVNNEVVMDYDTEYNNAVEYQKCAFDEYKNQILLDIAHAYILGNEDVSDALSSQFRAEQVAHSTRVNAIVKGGNE